jgi:hypothetical protein
VIVSTPEALVLLQAIQEHGWAQAQANKYAQKLRETDPEIRRIASDRPNLAEDHILARSNENHVHEFSQLPLQIVEALIKHLRITERSDRRFVHFVSEKPDAGMFPMSSRLQGDESHQRVAFITPTSVDLASNSSSLFLGYHSRYMLDGLAIEVITMGGNVEVLLHLKVADRTWTGLNPYHHYGYITIETDGTIRYERFSVQLDLQQMAEVSFGVKTKECLVTTRVAPGKSTNLDTMFPGAKHRLAEDLPHLPGFIVEVAESSMRRIRIPGF